MRGLQRVVKSLLASGDKDTPLEPVRPISIRGHEARMLRVLADARR